MGKLPIVPICLTMDQVTLCWNSLTDAVADADIGCSQDFKTKYLWHHRISGTVSLNMEKLKMEMTKCDSDEQECPRESLCFSWAPCGVALLLLPRLCVSHCHCHCNPIIIVIPGFCWCLSASYSACCPLLRSTRALLRKPSSGWWVSASSSSSSSSSSH